MKQTRLLMGMPITVQINDEKAKNNHIDAVYEYFKKVDERFSTYKTTSEISQLNRKETNGKKMSDEMKTILLLCEQTQKETNGYFNIEKNGLLDPSGLVKGWAINNAATLLSSAGFENFFIDAGGDIQMQGYNEQNDLWKVGIRNPFNRREIVKVISLTGKGVATSGTAIRGQHIYNPYHIDVPIKDIVSLTVIGPNIYEADRFATAAFAMGKEGILFIESLPEFEGYMIDKDGMATMTTGFDKYLKEQKSNLQSALKL